jgi:hypothetical protein
VPGRQIDDAVDALAVGDGRAHALDERASLAASTVTPTRHGAGGVFHDAGDGRL